jgi:hypothetical protein
LREIHASSGPDVDAKLGDAIAHRLNVAEKTSFKPLDPRDHDAPYRGVCQMVEPRGELRKCFDAEHRRSVIERLQSIKSGLAGQPATRDQILRERCRKKVSLLRTGRS